MKKYTTRIDSNKLILSLILVIFHLRPFQHVYPNLDYFINSGISRICVPFFFFVSGYFVSYKQKENPLYIKTYNLRNIKTYLIWSVIYLPFLVLFIFQNFEYVKTFIDKLPITHTTLILFSPIIFILTILVLLFYSGVYYHLWFFPALLISINIIVKWTQKHTIQSLLIISFVLLILGASETYWGFLPFVIQNILQHYYRLFITTRNFIFFGLFYVTFGYYAQRKIKLKKNYCFLVISILLFVSELLLIKNSNRMNSNILISVLPLTYVLFTFSILTTYVPKTNIAQTYPKYIFLVHPIAIYLVSMLQLSMWPRIGFVYGLCVLLAKFMIVMESKRI